MSRVVAIGEKSGRDFRFVTAKGATVEGRNRVSWKPLRLRPFVFLTMLVLAKAFWIREYRTQNSPRQDSIRSLRARARACVDGVATRRSSDVSRGSLQGARSGSRGCRRAKVETCARCARSRSFYGPDRGSSSLRACAPETTCNRGLVRQPFNFCAFSCAVVELPRTRAHCPLVADVRGSFREAFNVEIARSACGPCPRKR